MINNIIDGICKGLNLEFGDAYEIYTESIEQNLVEPCFSIISLNPTTEQFLGNRYFATNQFCIHYFPCTSDKRSEMNDVTERMFDCLEYIQVGNDVCRGTSMHGEISDDVLNFFVNYDMFIHKQTETKVAMEDYEYVNDIKE